MTTVYKYNIFCIDEHDFVSTWGTSKPTKCPNDTSHEVNLDSVNIAQTIEENKVTIENEKIPFGAEPTNGYYKCDSIKLICAPNSITAYDLQEVIPVCIKTINFSASNSNVGDDVTITTKPDTLIGLTPSEILNGQNTFEVPVTTLPYLKKGFFLKLRDETSGTNVDEMDQITSVDTVNRTVTTKNSTTRIFPTGTQILIERRVIDTFYINAPGIYALGSAVPSSSYVPANTVTKVIYNNTSNDEKTFGVFYEYYY